jgi:mannose-6-phosphate isomerase-like protein (cupin superfamily)
MAGYTIKNLQDVDNSAPEGAGDGLEARFARKHLDSEHLGVSYFRYGAGYRAPYGHRHREQEEAYVVVSGSGRLRLDDDIVDLKRWDVVRVAPQVARAFEGGADGLEIIAIGADRPEGGDGELVEDFWTD